MVSAVSLALSLLLLVSAIIIHLECRKKMAQLEDIMYSGTPLFQTEQIKQRSERCYHQFGQYLNHARYPQLHLYIIILQHQFISSMAEFNINQATQAHTGNGKTNMAAKEVPELRGHDHFGRDSAVNGNLSSCAPRELQLLMSRRLAEVVKMLRAVLICLRLEREGPRDTSTHNDICHGR